MGSFDDLTGNKYGRLTVIRRVPNMNGHTMWLCKCECETEISVAARHLKSGDTRSCGCYRKEAMASHFMSKTRLYKIWSNMKTRCNNPQNKRYTDYGARGIRVCNEWNSNFDSFYNWSMSSGYSDSLTIDRINVNGNYEPDNCRWITKAEQNSNKRNTVFITYNGITETMAWWANKLNLYKATISKRHRKGWSDEECLFGKGVDKCL